MNSLRALLDRIAPLRTPERAAGVLTIVVLVLALVVAPGMSGGGGAGGSPSPSSAASSPRPSAVASPSAASSPRPSATSISSPAPTISPAPSSPPASASPATSLPTVDLRAVATVDDRLASLSTSIKGELATTQPRVGVLVTLLRQVNATLVAGSGAVDALTKDPATSRLGEDIAAGHDKIGNVITATLALSLTETAAYKSGARQVADLTDDLAPLDAQVDDLLAGR